MAHSPLASMRRLFKKYLYDCRRRNFFWGLTLEQFASITRADCVYCGSPPARKSRAYLFNGIDRMNTKMGYSSDNVVPSCYKCNMIKGSILSFDEMRVVGKALAEFWRENGEGNLPQGSKKKAA